MATVTVWSVGGKRDMVLKGITDVRETLDRVEIEQESGDYAVYFKQHIIGYDVQEDEE